MPNQKNSMPYQMKSVPNQILFKKKRHESNMTKHRTRNLPVLGRSAQSVSHTFCTNGVDQVGNCDPCAPDGEYGQQEVPYSPRVPELKRSLQVVRDVEHDDKVGGHCENGDVAVVLRPLDGCGRVERVLEIVEGL